jgi:integrase
MAGIHRLSARAAATKNAPGIYADGGGLYLQVTRGSDGTARRSWLLRYRAPDGRRREMGLGPASHISLTDVRQAALAARTQARAGIDPIDARDSEKLRAAKKRAKVMTFRHCAEAYIAAHSSSWKNAKHRWQWENSLEVHVYPMLGSVRVSDVDADLVMRVLDPIWQTKTETATRVRGRIEAILDWAAVRGHRTGDNPARWRGHLQKALPTIKKSLRVKRHAALPFAEMAPFMKRLSDQAGVSARALEFCILTATRTGETIHARWSEIDLSNRTWTIPAERMKVPRPHRVPLSSAALSILSDMGPPAQPTDFIFPGLRQGRPLSNMALLMTLKRMGRGDLTTHGFRSTFRDWAAERTDFPREVAEAALAHIVSNQVEAAYRRGDLFEKRRKLMDAWNAYCVPVPTIARMT